ncbi:MAG TPA: hypothetical protein VFG09_10810 [Thermodesulfovibrionales bacterium]|jgi:hypothetical protein|nr:hypothetical protein [Thermodesulfovibrionales bacterium]
MMKRRNLIGFGILFFSVALLFLPAITSSREGGDEVKLINPEGVVNIEPMKVNPHPVSLEGKTVVLQWNGKQNGDNFLNQVAALLIENVKNIKIIKAWQEAPEVKIISQNPEKSRQLAQRIAAFRPDLVIAGQAD